MTAPDITAEQSLALEAAAQNLLFREARTANTFTDEPVDDATLAAIYDLVKWAPTSMNIQPLRIVAVRSDDAKKRLLPLLAEGNRAKTENAPLTVILAADNNFHDHLHRTFPHNPNARNFFLDDDARTATARFNGALQVGYFILGVRAAGLAAGPMTGFDSAGVDREFFVDGDVSSLAVVNIGKPGENAWFDRSPRLEHEDVVRTV